MAGDRQQRSGSLLNGWCKEGRKEGREERRVNEGGYSMQGLVRGDGLELSCMVTLVGDLTPLTWRRVGVQKDCVLVLGLRIITRFV